MLFLCSWDFLWVLHSPALCGQTHSRRRKRAAQLRFPQTHMTKTKKLVRGKKVACGIGRVFDKADSKQDTEPVFLFFLFKPLLHTITQNRSTHSHHSRRNEGQKYAVIKRMNRQRERGWGQETKAELCNWIQVRLWARRVLQVRALNQTERNT